MESEFFEQREDGSYILQGEKAVELWQLGKKRWNEEIRRFPSADVNFSSVDFAAYRTLNEAREWEAISFILYNFPNGDVVFDNAIFGSGAVFFASTNFANGSVSFQNTIFGEGSLRFDGARFGKGRINLGFHFVGQGDFSFSNVTLEDNKCVFGGMVFANGNINIQRTKFPHDIYFHAALTGSVNLNLKDSNFQSKLLLNSLSADLLEDISLRNCAFEDVLLLPKLEQGKTFSFVPDLLNTKISHHVDTTGISIALEPRKPESKLFGIFSKTLWGKEGDSQKLMRLKEIAEDHKDHDKALDFFKWEMRAKRWRDGKIWGNLLDLAYDRLSDYGKSVMKPVAGLASIFVIWAFFYKMMSAFHGTWGNAFAFSASQALLGVPSTKLLGGESYERLFKVVEGVGIEKATEPFLSGWGHMVIYAENFFAFVFLFLIGLALRNRFRLK